MKWKISLTESGAYKLTPLTGEANDRVLAVEAGVLGNAKDNGYVLQQRDYVEDTNYKDEWELYGQVDYTLMYLGYEANDPRMIPILSSVSTALRENVGMQGYGDRAMTKQDALLRLSSSTIFSGITHGSQTGLTVSDGYLTVSDINALDDSAFDDLKFVCLCACYNGMGRAEQINMVNTIYNKGADTVLGFVDEVFVLEGNKWTEDFMLQLSEGMTVENAAKHADGVVSQDKSIKVPYYSTSKPYRYLEGSWDFTLYD